MTSRLAAAIAALLALSAPVSAAVTVTSDDPSRFTDADRAGGIMTPQAAAASLAASLERLGDRLPPGRDLAVRILDIDLAGRIAPERALSPTTRFLDRSTWPRVRLAFRLTERGRVIASGEERVDRKDYLERPTARFSGDPLRYEKTMLAEWFAARFERDGRPR